MSNIKSMFAKMSDAGGGGDVVRNDPPPKATSKKATIESTYQKKSQLEHILLRPDTYIGSVEKASETMWIFDKESKAMVQKKIEYVPGLYKIFDEILVNAADNKQRDKTMDCIKVDIDTESNTISVWNNGEGIPVEIHKDEKMYVPTMIFGHLLTSSNYNDAEEKVTGGRNGYGAKLCNIFSTKFVVETASKQYKRSFKQSWGSNMSKTSEPKVKDHFGSDFTKVSFCPDLTKFKMDKLDDDIVGLMCRRAYDIAASTRGVKVILNGERLAIKNFKDYIDLYIKDKEDDTGNALKVFYENSNERWEVAMTLSDTGFQQVSFVNSIATTKGGRHVDYIADMLTKQLIEVIKKKNKGGIVLKPFQIKNHMWLFVNCLIVNPTFDSQTKENMTLQPKSFGSKCTLSEKFITGAVKSGIVEAVLSWARHKAQEQLNKKGSGKKITKLKGIPKLEDANEAGSRNSLKCTLILTEGDSAKSLAVSGLGVIGRDYYGVFPLRGKLLNVREATHKQILENAEINNLIKILGLQYKVKYRSPEDMKTLRYGKVMIMTDQDQDGSHIKGLLINFIHYNWPDLLKQEFLEEFITPIVKATKTNQELSFYSLPEFEEWKANTLNHHTFNVKYYKGLGTSTSKEAKEYFTNIARHRIRFRYSGQQDDDHILLAFSKKHVDQRKEWLTNFMLDSKRRKELGLPEKYLYEKDTKFVNYTDFVNMELVLFSNADNVRSIPSMVDGLKPGQRKILFACIKRNDKKEVKVAQLAGSVAYLSAYHHGEVSLCMTIVNLAQNFVGSNNINLLEPRGQFGTRLTGGKDSASARYIFTKMSPLTRTLFHPQDDPLLKAEYDDNKRIEPVWYIPIIPMVLVNGAEGIGTGWMTKIPNYNPRELISLMRHMIDGNDISKKLIPFYKNFKGTIDDCGEGRYVCSGEIAILGQDRVEITELPVGTWTQNYKESVLEIMLHGNEKQKAVLSDYKEYNTDTTVKFNVQLLPGQLHELEKDGGLHKAFKLQSLINTSSMCAFDELGCLRKFECVMDIVQEFYELRLRMYTKRKEYLEGMLQAEVAKLSNQARFISEKCDGSLVVENKKRKTIVDELVRRGYDPDPVVRWKESTKVDDGEEDEGGEEEDDLASDTGHKKKAPEDSEKAFKKLSDVKKFDYLLGMSMWMLTDERKEELLRQRDAKRQEYEILVKKTNKDLWREDLDVFAGKLDEVEEKERLDEAGDGKTKKLGAKKKIHIEAMPSPMGKRIAPVVTEEIRKKVQMAIKTKEKITKRKEKLKDGSIKAENADELDEFDKMVGNKSLTEKLNTDAAKKRSRKPKEDGFTQTKLNFNNVKKGKKSKKSSDGDSENESGSDVELSNLRSSGNDSITSPISRARRTTVKAIKYQLDSDEEDGVGNGNASDDSLHSVEIVDDAPKLTHMVDESDEDEPPPKAKPADSSDLFDSLLGKSSEKEEPPKENSDSQPKRKRAPKSAMPAAAKKPTKSTSDSDDEFVRKPKKKRNQSSSEEWNDDSDADAPARKAGGRAAAKKKYTFDDSDSDY